MRVLEKRAAEIKNHPFSAGSPWQKCVRAKKGGLPFDFRSSNRLISNVPDLA